MSTLFGYEVVEQAQEIDRLSTEIASLTAENERLRSVLKYIARNTCCDTCQEAALVAKEALTGPMADTRAALQPKEEK